MKLIALTGTCALALVIIGCSSTPTALDRTFSNVETNYVPRLVLQTNIITLTQTNTVIETVTRTNEIGIPTPIFITNSTTYVTYATNLVVATNLVPQYVLTPNTNVTATIGVVGEVANIFAPGVGGLVTSGLLGLLSIFLGIRNRQFAGKNSVLIQSAGVLAQIIETGREVLAKEPQGQRAADAFTQWMITHQAETQTIAKISEIVKVATNNAEAKAAADQILALIGQPANKPPA